MRNPSLPGDPERAVLVGVVLRGGTRPELEEHLDELSSLLHTAGGREVSRLVVERDRPDASTFIGRGKTEALGEEVRRTGAELVVFDDDLSPAQSHKLEQQVGARIVDRSGLILDIFARRARSREARIQVDLAQLRYLLPRLTRRWSHLSRQVGGIGVRGVGEKQLELDRRLVRKRIGHLQRQLEAIDRARRERRKRRGGSFRAALVGYTNTGKTTLLNLLTGAEGLAENRLFATLDPLVRRMPAAGGAPILLADTVGFVRKLPHALVASFRSTLQEAVDADLLLHVVDLSHPDHEAQMETTREVLADLGLSDRLEQLVCNKIDRAAPGVRERALRLQPDALLVSARSGEGIAALRERILMEARGHGNRAGGASPLPGVPPRAAGGGGG